MKTDIEKEILSIEKQIKSLQNKAEQLHFELNKNSIDHKEIDRWVKTALEFQSLKGQTIYWGEEVFGVITNCEYHYFAVNITHPLVKAASYFNDCGDSITIEDNDNELRAFGKKFKFKAALFDRMATVLFELECANWIQRAEFDKRLKQANSK